MLQYLTADCALDLFFSSFASLSPRQLDQNLVANLKKQPFDSHGNILRNKSVSSKSCSSSSDFNNNNNSININNINNKSTNDSNIHHLET